MSNRSEHTKAGMWVGGAAAAVSLIASGRAYDLADLVAEVLGGTVAGAIGARLPDVIEPATSSWHRSTAHSVAVGAGVTYASVAHASRIANRLRGTGDTRLERIMARVAAGALMGAPAGYVSHVALDAGTARGVPLLTRGM